VQDLAPEIWKPDELVMFQVFDLFLFFLLTVLKIFIEEFRDPTELWPLNKFCKSCASEAG